MNKSRRSFHGKAYQVVDIWHAIMTTGKCWLGLAAAVALATGVILLLLATPFAFKVWHAQSPGIQIDPQQATLSFSADDLENSLHDILSLRRFFDHARRISIALHDIERLDNDTSSTGRGQLRRRRFALNLSGDFGSYQLMFSHKQKRDECRTLINQSMQRIKGRAPSRDPNIAFPY